MGRFWALGLVALSSFGFALQSLVVKVITREAVRPVPAMEIVFFRGCIQALGCLCTLSCHGPVARAPRRWCGDSLTEVKWLALRGFVGFGGICFGFKSVSMVGLAESQVVNTASPVFSAVYARVFLDEPWLALEKAAAVVCFLGVGIQFYDGGDARPARIRGDDLRHVVGLLYALLGAATGSGAQVIVRMLGTRIKVDWPIPMLYQATGQILLAGVALAAFHETPRFDLTPRQLGLLAACGAIGFVSQVFMTRGMMAEKSASASIMRLSGLPWSFFFQAIATDEPIRTRTYVGAAVILVAMALILHSARAKRAAPPKKPSLRVDYAPVAVRVGDKEDGVELTAARVAVAGARGSDDDDDDDGDEDPPDGTLV